MQILFTSRPAFGHVFPLMPLALAARSAGHEVIFASGEAFIPRLEGWGFPARKVGVDLDWAFGETAARFPELMEPIQLEFGGAMFIDVAGMASLEDARPLIDEVRPDLLVHEATDVGSAVAGAAAGVPVACVGISLWLPPFAEVFERRSSILWEAAGAAPTIDVGVGDIFLDQWPTSMQHPEARSRAKRYVSTQPVPWGDPDSPTPSWIADAEKPFVFVSLGTMFYGKDVLEKVIGALSQLDVDALVLAGADATPDELPSDGRVRVGGFVDQPEVLRNADLVVHHGGAGTIFGSLVNGLPQLILPEGADRPFTSANVRDAGAALVLDPREASESDIASSLNELISKPTYREAAERIQKEIQDMRSPEEVVRELELLVGSRTATDIGP